MAEAPLPGPVQRAEPARASVGELFHRVNKLLPEGQELLSVRPDTSVAEALELMLANNFSQLPVVSGGQVLGAFSYRSFARGALDIRDESVSPLTLPVDEFIEQHTLVDVTAELNSLFDALDADGAILVGRPDDLAGILTGVDALRYVTLELAPGTVDAEDVEESWPGERRMKPGRERWIPARFRPSNADAYQGTARAVGHSVEAAKAGAV